MLSRMDGPVLRGAQQKARGDSHRLQQGTREKLLREAVETSPLGSMKNTTVQGAENPALSWICQV